MTDALAQTRMPPSPGRPPQALSQGEDLSAGKSPAQLFAADCAACHRSPAGLARNRHPSALAGFLREHYTSSVRHASALASYLASVRGDPRGAVVRNPAAGPTGAGAAAAAPPGPGGAAGLRPPAPIPGLPEDASAAAAADEQAPRARPAAGSRASRG